VTLYHGVEGDGPPVVFLHEAIADSRMWEPQWTSFGTRYRVVRCDLAGFGRTPIERLPVTMRRMSSTCWTISASRPRVSSAPRWAAGWRSSWP
jgi:pimeloyl-ACP methyl ester carboxylesterase